MPPECDRLKRNVMLCLVEKSFTSSGSAKTRNPILAAHFAFEFVVVGQLLVSELGRTRCRDAQHAADVLRTVTDATIVSVLSAPRRRPILGRP